MITLENWVEQYELTIEEVKKIMPDFTAFYYVDDNKYKYYYMTYFVQSQNHLSTYFNKYTNSNSYFFYNSFLDKNAYAVRSNVISINMGLMQRICELHLTRNIFIESEELSSYKELNNILKSSELPSLMHIMWQGCTQWLYFHELGHLAQDFNSLSIGGLNMSEKYNFTNDTYDLKKTMKEIDSDLAGVHAILLRIYNISRKLVVKNDLQKYLVMVLIIYVASLLSLLILFNPTSREFYIREYDHPHPIIRIIFISNELIRNFNKVFNLKLDAVYIVTESFRINNELFGNDWGDKYGQYLIDTFDLNDKEIESYINEIRVDILKFPDLLINTNHEIVRKVFY